MLEKYALIKVMEEVLVNAASVYSVNGTAKKAGVSVFAAKHALDYLYKKGMLTREIIGRTYQYRADRDNYLTRQWKVTFSVEELHDKGLIRKMLETKKEILSIVLYGSAAVGRDDENSDIDILVIADADSKGKGEIISKGSFVGGKEPNILVYTPEEWRSKAEKDKVFYEKAIIDSIALYGEKPVVL